MAHDHHVVVASGDAREETAAVGALEIGLARRQHIRCWVEQCGVVRPLLDEVIGHHDHRFAGKPHPAAFHRTRNRGEGLARAHDMIVEHSGIGHAAPDPLSWSGTS